MQRNEHYDNYEKHVEELEATIKMQAEIIAALRKVIILQKQTTKHKKAGQAKPDYDDKHANCIPNPKHRPKYTKAKVLHTQDKHTSAEQHRRALQLALLPYKTPCC